MTFLVERLAELRRHVDHIEELRPHEYVSMDLALVMAATNELQSIRQFIAIVAALEAS